MQIVKSFNNPLIIPCYNIDNNAVEDSKKMYETMEYSKYIAP